MNFELQAAQGDLLITRVNEIPADAKPAQVCVGVYVLAHSETGHHHVIDVSVAECFEAANDPFVSYLRVSKATPIRHLRSFDTHAPIHVQPGLYRVNRQREYTPEGFRRAAD